MTSKPGEKPVVRLAADANVLLAATLGHAAHKAFDRSLPILVEVVSTKSVLEEVREYLPTLAHNEGLDPRLMQKQFGALKVEEVPAKAYRDKLEEARRRIGERDPDDVELLALALSLGIPVWSNDSDFEQTGVEWYTTARLLAKYGIFGK